MGDRTALLEASRRFGDRLMAEPVIPDGKQHLAEEMADLVMHSPEYKNYFLKRIAEMFAEGRGPKEVAIFLQVERLLMRSFLLVPEKDIVDFATWVDRIERRRVAEAQP